MANEPSLGELTNMRVDGDLGGGSPSVVIDNSKLVGELNQNARFRAEKSHQKYTQFLSNLTDVYKQIGDAASLPVLTEDRPLLEKKMGDIFSTIAKNPKALTMPGAAQTELYKSIAEYKGLATESKKNNLYVDAHDKLLALHPEFNTKDNKELFGNFRKQELGKRNAFQLKMPVIADEEKLYTTLTDPKNKKFTGVYEETPKSVIEDGFIVDKTKKTYKFEPFIKKWDAAIDYNSNKYGQTYRKWAEQNLENLQEDDPELYDHYLNQVGGGDKNKAVAALWHDKGIAHFGGDKDIVAEESNKIRTASPYDIEQYKQTNRLQLLGEKHKNTLSEIRERAKLGVDAKKEFLSWSNETRQAAYDDYFENEQNKAFADESKSFIENYRVLPVSQPTRDYFKETLYDKKGKKIVGSPDYLSISEDKETVIPIFLKKDGTVDEDKAKPFPYEEYKAKIEQGDLGKAGYAKIHSTSTKQKGVSSTSTKQKIYKAKLADGKIITSTDGTNWVDENGNKIQ